MTTDPRGIVRKDYHDALGRTITTIEAYTNGTPTNNTNKTTAFTYDGSGHLLTLTAVLPHDAYQTTQFVYSARTADGSALNSNDLLAATRYPDPSTGDPSGNEEESYTVNALGERTTLTDRNGSVHTYTYDVVGRPTTDAVTTLGSGVDGAVRRLEIGYNSAGQAYLFTSYDAAASGNVVNQVQQVYNGLGQLITEYQAQSGAVNTQTTPQVQYAYSEMASGANHSRLVSMTYPNGRVLNYNYAGGLDSSLSRLSSLSDTSATLEAYSYLGLHTVVTRAHPEPDIDLTYVKRAGDSNGDAGDPYIGLDRFGRVVDQRWLDPSTGDATDRFQYGYDRNGNRLFRKNLVDAAFSELYHAHGASNGYDDLNQLVAFARGTLSDSNSDGVPDTIASPSRSQSWAFDALGNWTTVTTDSVDQDRTHNRQNELTSVEDLTSPAYDAHGNLTTDEQARTLVYDAWSRLVEVLDGQSVLVSYGHDALGRRVEEDDATTRALYYSTTWQVLEEREDNEAVVQYAWSPVYIDALVLRDRDTDANGSLDERLYVQQDANGNGTAVVHAAGTVQERYVYDPYGLARVWTPAWGSRGSSVVAWSYLHQGGRYESTTGLYHVRMREESPALGRWSQRDPLGYVAGDTNLYRYLGNSSPSRQDPLGLLAPTPAPVAPPSVIPIPSPPVWPILVGGGGAIGIGIGAVCVVHCPGVADAIAEWLTGISAEEMARPISRPFLPPGLPEPKCPKKKDGPCEFYLAWCEWGVTNVPADNPNWTHTIGECLACYEVCANGGEWNSWPFDDCPIKGTDPTRNPTKPGQKPGPRWPRPDEPYPWEPQWP